MKPPTALCWSVLRKASHDEKVKDSRRFRFPDTAISTRSSFDSDGRAAFMWRPTKAFSSAPAVVPGYDFHQYPNPPQAGGVAAYGIYIDSKGAMWFGCGRALCTFSQDRVTTVSGSKEGVPPEHWEAVVGDHEGNLWIRSRTQVRSSVGLAPQSLLKASPRRASQ